MRVKIGDFGLALAVSSKPNDTEAEKQDSIGQLEILGSSSSKNSKGNTTDSHSVGIGTALYMAPEIYFDAHYTNLVDMFSLGVIIVEMCYPMETQSERVRVLSSFKPLKTADISITAYKQMVTNFEPTFPKDIHKFVTEEELKLIKLLLDASPKKRPSAESLLKKGVFGVSAMDQKSANDNLVSDPLLSVGVSWQLIFIKIHFLARNGNAVAAEEKANKVSHRRPQFSKLSLSAAFTFFQEPLGLRYDPL